MKQAGIRSEVRANSHQVRFQEAPLRVKIWGLPQVTAWGLWGVLCCSKRPLDKHSIEVFGSSYLWNDVMFVTILPRGEDKNESWAGMTQPKGLQEGSEIEECQHEGRCADLWQCPGDWQAGPSLICRASHKVIQFAALACSHSPPWQPITAFFRWSRYRGTGSGNVELGPMDAELLVNCYSFDPRDHLRGSLRNCKLVIHFCVFTCTCRFISLQNTVSSFSA